MFHINLFNVKVSNIVKILIVYIMVMLNLQDYAVTGKSNANKKTFDIQIKSNTRSAAITCKNCFKFQEEILMEVLCLNESCSSNFFQYTYSDPVLIVDQLTPFTSYILNIKTCRKIKSYYKSCTKINEQENFQTKPSTPRFVQEFSTYSKNESSVSMRWKPPYPPTGQLYSYEIQYFIVDLKIEDVVTQQIPIQSCELWPEYHCYTLSNLESKQNYSISLRARNKEPSVFGQVQTIHVISMKEPSEAPYDLNVQWTDKEYFIVNWKHPNKTNGDIEYFIITLSFNKDKDKPIKKHFFKSIDKHMWQYTFKIDEKECLNLTSFEIGITAFNGYVGKELSVNFSSPDYQKEIRTQHNDHNNKLEQEILDNNATGTKNTIHRDDFVEKLINNSSNVSGNSEEKNGGGKGLDSELDNTIDSQNYISSPVPKYYEKKEPQTVSSRVSMTGYKIVEKGNSVLTLFLSLILSSIIVVSIVVVLWIKKSSWTNVSGCKGLFCIRINNNNNDNVRPHEEAPLTTTHFENSKSDDIYLYTQEAIKTERNRNKENNTINFEHEYKTPFSNPIELEKFKELSAREDDIENEFKMFVEKTPTTVYETLDQQLFEYIDLVYDDGTRIPKAYVATKMPMADTIQNFWKQVFEDNIQFIVLLGEVGSIELQYKYQQYWPDDNKKMVYPDISVQQIYSKTYSCEYYTIRKFVLVVDETIKQVDQIHCVHSGSNPRKLAPFIKKLLQLQSKNNSSALVHSSTGIGGVGTVLLCSLSLRLGHNKKTIDVLQSMHMLRKYKSGFIRNPEQYKLIYLIISHVIFPYEDDNSSLNDYINY